MTSRSEWPAPCGCDFRNSWDRPMTFGPEQVICPAHWGTLMAVLNGHTPEPI